MRYFLLLFMLLPLSVLAQRVDPCKLFGTFYKVNQPGMADLVVYEEDSEYFAQLRIFEEENKLYADAAGLWFFEEKPEFANYRVYFTKRRSQADVTVFFVNSLSKAGCK